MTSSFLSALLAELLVIAALGKLLDPRRFREALQTYTALSGLPSAALRVLAAVIGPVELATSALLVVRPSRLVGALTSMILLTSFYLLIARDQRPAFANCGCGGSKEVAAPRHAYLVRNLVLLACNIALLVTVFAESTPSNTTGALVALAAMALPFALVVTELPLILHMFAVDRLNMPAKLDAVRGASAITFHTERRAVESGATP